MTRVGGSGVFPCEMEMKNAQPDVVGAVARAGPSSPESRGERAELAFERRGHEELLADALAA